MDTVTILPNVQTNLVTMTPAASQVVRKLLDDKGVPDYHLRVFVTGGGCSGMQYGMAFEAQPRPGDTVIEASNNVKMLIDPQSAMYLSGATVDYVDSLMGGGFRIDNPTAVSSCGCGHSFRPAGAQSAQGGGGGCGSGGCGSH